MNIIDKIKTIWRKNSPELTALFNGAFPDFVMARKPQALEDTLPVFCYHLVNSARFEADLLFLTENGYSTVSGDQAVEFLARRGTAIARPVLLTFDDGPRNFYEVAYPLLLKYRHKAVIFIAPGLHEDDINDFDPSWPRPMSWDQLREMHASGYVDIQCHTLESRYVPAWPQPAALAGCHPQIEAARRGVPLPLREDLLAARELLQRRLAGAQIRHLAFPQYDGTDEAMRIAAETGYTSCMWGMLPSRPVNRRGATPLQISRISGEYLRRLPATERISRLGLILQRLRIIAEGYQWRSRHERP